MSEGTREKYSELAWYEGAALPPPTPLVSTVALFEGDEGQALRLRVSGYEEAIGEYLEEMAFAFRIRPIEDVEGYRAEQKLPGAEAADETRAVPTMYPAISVELDLVGAEAPYEWEVFIDPVNRYIAGYSSPHYYRTTATTWMRATITADFGLLRMSSWGRSVVVGNANPAGTIERHIIPQYQVPVEVDGLDQVNRYDLYLRGALLL